MYPLKKSISLALGLVLLATVAVVITTGTVGASPRVNSIAAAPPDASDSGRCNQYTAAGAGDSQRQCFRHRGRKQPARCPIERHTDG